MLIGVNSLITFNVFMTQSTYFFLKNKSSSNNNNNNNNNDNVPLQNLIAIILLLSFEKQ